jgi:hypothetical protein
VVEMRGEGGRSFLGNVLGGGFLGMTCWRADRKQHQLHSGQERVSAISLKAIFLLIDCSLGLILAFYSSAAIVLIPPSLSLWEDSILHSACEYCCPPEGLEDIVSGHGSTDRGTTWDRAPFIADKLPA